MLAGGIAAHTAGAVFVLGLLGVRLSGALSMAPWLLPPLVGVPAIVVLLRRTRAPARPPG
jgi:hypothetical protein